MGFQIALLVLVLVANLCVYAAVSRVLVRVSTLESRFARSGSLDLRPYANSDVPPPLTEKTIRAAEVTGATRILVVQSGCGACDRAMAELSVSEHAERTLVVAASNLDGVMPRLRVIEDSEQVRALVAQGYVIPTVLELQSQPTEPSM